MGIPETPCGHCGEVESEFTHPQHGSYCLECFLNHGGDVAEYTLRESVEVDVWNRAHEASRRTT